MMRPAIAAKKHARHTSGVVAEEIERLIRQFGSADLLLAAIRSIPGFGKTNQSTLYRWQKNLVDQSRAKLAVRLLKEREQSVPLRLALPETLQVLPVSLLLWDDVNASKDEPYGLLKRLGVQARVASTGGGFEALELLRNGDYDVAFAAEEFGQGYQAENIFRLCQISESFWSGLTTLERTVAGKKKKGITEMEEFKGLRVGYNANTALVKKLPALAERFGINWDLVRLANAEDAIQRLSKKGSDAIHAILGWEPLLSQVEDHFRTHGQAIHPVKLSPFIHDAFSVKVWLYVHKESTNATAIRLLLASLLPAIRLISTAQMDAADGHESKLEALCRACLKKLGKEWELNMPSLRKALDRNAAKYSLGWLEPHAILDFWKVEILDERKRKAAT